RHTRFSRDWSSDVCSSDLAPLNSKGIDQGAHGINGALGVLAVNGDNTGKVINLRKQLELADFLFAHRGKVIPQQLHDDKAVRLRSEERRVGKEGRCRWSPY